MVSLDLGPWTWTGYTSGSRTLTSIPLWIATPRAHSPASESASASHHRSVAMRSRTGSLTIPPSSAVISTYLPWPTAHFVRSRQVRVLTNADASGPVISTIRSTETSHNVTSLSSAQYSSIGSV